MTGENGGFDFGNFLNETVAPLAGQVASKYVDQFLYGEDTANELQLQQARNRFNLLNGSGAADPALSMTSPFSLRDFLFRRVQNPTTGAVSETVNYLPIALGAGALLLLVILLRR